MSTIEAPYGLEKVLSQTPLGTIAVIWRVKDKGVVIVFRDREGGTLTQEGGTADSLDEAIRLVKDALKC